MVSQSIIKTVQNYLTTLQQSGLSIDFGVIYGSYANGVPHEWSDVDLLVVAPQFDHERKRTDISLLWRTAAQVDARIEPLACGSKQWQEDDASALIEIARRAGYIVQPLGTKGRSL